MNRSDPWFFDTPNQKLINNFQLVGLMKMMHFSSSRAFQLQLINYVKLVVIEIPLSDGQKSQKVLTRRRLSTLLTQLKQLVSITIVTKMKGKIVYSYRYNKLPVGRNVRVGDVTVIWTFVWIGPEKGEILSQTMKHSQRHVPSHL